MSRGNVDELEKQVGGWDTHGTGYVLSDVCASQRRSGARRGLGAVSDDRGGVGNFCFVVCEVEVGGGSWWREKRRADWLEMRRSRRRAILPCQSAASLRGGSLTSFARKCGAVRMTNAPRVIRVVDSALKCEVESGFGSTRKYPSPPVTSAESIVLCFINNLGRHASGFPQCST